MRLDDNFQSAARIGNETAPGLAFAAPSSALPQHAMADFALLRISGLPFAAIDALRLPRTEALLDRIADAEARMEQARQPAADALYRLVPQLEQDDKLRRVVVNLRRHIHNGRTNRPRAADLAAIEELLTDPDEAALLAAWLEAQAHLAEAAGALDDAVGDETQTVLRPALRAPLAIAHFRRAVALANPRTLREATREKRLPRTAWPDKLERSLLGYLARAATKTSPFSSFMANALVPASAEGAADHPPHARGARYESLSVLNRGVVTALDEAAFALVARAGGLTLSVNPTLQQTAKGKHVGLCGRQITLGGRAWYEQRWAQFRLGPDLGRVLQPGLALDWPGWVGRLEAIGIAAPEAEKLLGQLMARGVLLAEPLTDGYDPVPSARLSRRWRDSHSPVLQDAAADLDLLQSLADGFADTPADQRVATLDRIAKLQGELSARVAPAAGEALQNLVLEDCWLDGVSGRLGGEMLAPLRDLQDFLSGQIAVSPLYARLVQAFVDVYGEGGECREVVSFLLAVVGHLIDLPEFGARLDAAPSIPAPPGVTAPVTAHLQIARNGAEDVHFVVNRVFDGGGWLASRFTLGDHPQQGQVRRGLSDWMARISGPDLPVDLPISGHCSDLQAHARLTPMVLGWPGEPLRQRGDIVLPADRLRLRHDPETGFLRLSDDAGRGISLHYLGNTFPTPSWGVRYALSVLTRPFTVARPNIAPPVPQDGTSPEDPAFLHRPALRHGRVVLRREAWWVRSDHLARHWFAGSPAEQLRAARRDCDRHGIPPCLFAQIHVPPQRNSLVTQDMLDAYRKPIWLDTRNPFWLAMLERIARKSDWIVLTRPDPDPSEAWMQADGQPHATELHLELLIAAGASRTAPGFDGGD